MHSTVSSTPVKTTPATPAQIVAASWVSLGMRPEDFPTLLPPAVVSLLEAAMRDAQLAVVP